MTSTFGPYLHSLTFQLAPHTTSLDFFSRPQTSSRQGPPHGGAIISTREYNDTGDQNDHISFLTDKCNALSIRLQQVETQLRAESTERFLCASPSYSTVSNTHTHDPAWQQDHSRASTAEPRLSPRARMAARPSVHASPRAPRSSPTGAKGGNNVGGPSRAVGSDDRAAGLGYDGSRQPGFLGDNDESSAYICSMQGYYETEEGNLTPRAKFQRARTGSESPSPSPERGEAQAQAQQRSPSSLPPGLLASPDGGYHGKSSWPEVSAGGGGGHPEH